MNLHEIEKLLEKYYNGETSLDEEKQLRLFFDSGEVPPKWKSLVEYFGFIREEKELKLDRPDFDDNIMEQLSESRVSRLFDLRRPWIYWASGVAASLLIMIAIFVRFDPFSSRIGDTYKDPQTAYVQARNILLFVSSKMNKGTGELKQITKFDEAMNELQPVASYDKSLSKINKLDEVDKVNRLLTEN